jgi:hypothetical protein
MSAQTQRRPKVVVARIVPGARTVRRCRGLLARRPDLSRIARGKLQSGRACRQIVGDSRDCLYSDRILGSLPTPGNAISSASGVRRSCLMFRARLNFIFTGGVFSAVVFVRFDQVKFSLRGADLLFILFSMFCLTIDVERIGIAFLKAEDSI